MSDSDPWERSPWQNHSVEAHTVWPDRRIRPPSPPSIPRGRPPDRTFEPSDNWKQKHVERTPRIETSPSYERYPDHRRRNSERSPARSAKSERTTGFASDTLRPTPSKKENYPSTRSDYDSYRPHYDTGWTPPGRREPSSPTVHQRRDSGSYAYSRSSDRYEPSYSGSHTQRKPSISPHLRASPAWSHPETEHEPWSYRPTAKTDMQFRAPSRSSIASTHVSDKKSPDVTPASVPVTVDPPASVAKLPTFSEGQSRTATIISEPKVKEAARPLQEQPSSTFNPVKSTPQTVQKQAEMSQVDSLGTDIAKLSQIIAEQANKPPEPVKELASQTNIQTSKNENAPTSLPPVPSSSKIASTPVVSPPADPEPNSQVPENQGKDIMENEGDTNDLKQPRPIYPPSPILNDMQSPAIDIPPPTHSPSLPTPPPIAATPPAVEPPVLPTPDEIPSFSEAKTLRDALRIVVMTRLLCDHQTQEERVQPVLAANLLKARKSHIDQVHPTSTPDRLIKKVTEGPDFKDLAKSFYEARPNFAQYIQARHSYTEEKIARLREEYRSLQERWTVHCNTLNEQQKTSVSEQENQHGGRTTRRTAAVTDAVRSDFEMELVLASLGENEATDPAQLSVNNVARIPDMIAVVNGQVDYVFDDSSRRVDNPAQYYAHEPGIQDWTEQEKQIFLDKFAAYPKQFGIIADYLPHKTAAQCVDYYYLHKKQFIDFRQVVSQYAPNKRKRRGMGKKKGNGLLVDIAKHDMEVSRNLESASSVAPTRAPRGRKTVAPKPPSAVRRNAVHLEDTPTTNTPTPEPEGRTRRRRAAAAAAVVAIAANANGASSSSASVVAPAPAAPTSVSAVATPEPAPTPVIHSAPPSIPPTPTPPKAPSPASSYPPPAPVHAPTPTSTAVPAPAPATSPASNGQSVFSIHPPKSSSGSGIGSGITSNISQPTFSIGELNLLNDEDQRPVKRQKRTRRIKSAAVVTDADELPSPGAEPPISVDDAAYRSRRDKALSAASTWSEDDKKQFLSLLAVHGDDFKRIASEMPNKTTTQVSNYYKANEVAYDLQKIVAGAPPRRSPSVDTWKESPHPASSSTAKAGATSGSSQPMSSLSGEAGRNGQPIPPYSSSSVPPRDFGRPPIDRPPMSYQRFHTPASYPMPPPPPMAHLSSSAPPDPRRTSVYSRSGSYAYADGPDARGMYYTNKPPESGTSHPPGSTYPPVQPYGAPGYARMSPPPPGHSHSSYVPPPPAHVGSAAPSIVHSPTGLASPKPLPMQPMQSYPSQQSDPSRTPYYPGPVPPPPVPVGVDPRMNPPPPHWAPQTGYYPHGGPRMYPPPQPPMPHGSMGGGGGSGREPSYPRYATQPPPNGTSPPYYYPGWTPQ
ncbi:hypothetical protein CPC08DRAFT_718550 [Agrocybe pediades]|nr:hypothetical protein CPC08DRAFT_718550 [Agrocybe pediades]